MLLLSGTHATRVRPPLRSPLPLPCVLSPALLCTFFFLYFFLIFYLFSNGFRRGRTGAKQEATDGAFGRGQPHTHLSRVCFWVYAPNY